MSARAIVRVAALVLLFLVCAPLHLATKALLRRSDWPRRFLAAVAWVIGVRLRVSGEPIRPHSLLLANHTSWIDIMVIAAATGCAFVSKDNLGLGLFHWLADQNATIYVRRSHVKGAKDQAIALANALQGEKPVAVFPEGTTGPGTHLLPFRSTLLEAASYADNEVEIRPVAIDYGRAHAEVGWWEESAKDNILRILGRRGTLPIAVTLLPPLDRSGDRKALALEAREAIARALGFKLDGHSPIGGGE
jgi:1-acyl-sn-glycerol-3-phosphate acyltransferase